MEGMSPFRASNNNINSGFWELKKQSCFADLTITIDGRDKQCYHVVLAGAPGYFNGPLNM
jgi:hypothetical protein